MDDWPAHKQSRDIAPFAQLPTIQFPNGEVIAQSGAIVRYAAKLAGIYPTKEIEAARADMLYEFAQDMNMISAILNFWPVRSETYTVNHAAYFRNFPSCCRTLIGLLDNSDGAFFGGNAPHHGDFALFYVMDASLTVEPQCLDDFPNIRAWMLRISSIPAISIYLQSRPPPSKVGLCGSFINSLAD